MTRRELLASLAAVPTLKAADLSLVTPKDAVILSFPLTHDGADVEVDYESLRREIAEWCETSGIRPDRVLVTQGATVTIVPAGDL